MEVKRFRADWRHVVETEFDDAQYVYVADFDRVTAERDALQQLLNARDEEIERLRGLLIKAHPLTNDIAHDPHVWLEIDLALENQA